MTHETPTGVTSAPVPLREVAVKLLTPPLTDLHPYPRNVRRATSTELANLRESIRQHGLMNPLVACRARGGPAGSYWVIDGCNRLLCLRDLGIETVPVKLYDAELTDEQMTAVMVVQDTTKKKLTPKQIAEFARELLDGGQFRAEQEVAAFLGLSHPQLSIAFRIKNQLAPDLLDRDLPLTVQHALSGAADLAVQRELADLYAKGLLKRDSLIAEVARRTHAVPKVAKKPKPVTVRTTHVALNLTGSVTEARAELETLAKALAKAESLGLGLTAVPDLMKGGTR